ncbi:glycine cleavage system protein GcvH [candidate division KSB3 bacterium]|uniref:Glycine cleavage system H protein n=1 Tax=candidate division KSB3 bacterium TaxID=2044937 RepID=A0A9D5Q8A3_9BACT|nr:glycine cleavage system protein GcvH [candidate division KSB3 bacterium]MBD3327117.1 glycine cleavage system protein GcvH [candidate division KSB3 bacterium]
MHPAQLRYSKTHEWIREEDGHKAVIGITDYAQDQLGDVVYVELPDVDTHVTQFEACGTIESVKTVTDVSAPLSGTVTTINDALDETPELMNTDPYGSGWIFELQIHDPHELEQLLSAKEYEALIQATSRKT